MSRLLGIRRPDGQKGETGVVLILWIAGIGILWLAGNAIINWIYDTKEARIERDQERARRQGKNVTTTIPEARGPGDYTVVIPQ